jgi:hypothetical protein
MNELEIKRLISITVVSSIVVSAIFVVSFNIDIASFEVSKIFSLTITVLTFYWAFYFKWGWKLPILKKIFEKPNLNGTWIGRYESEDGNGNKYFGRIILTVRQTFLFTHLTSLTDKTVSHSYGESLLSNKDKGINRIAYFYFQERLDSSEEDIPQCATELTVLGKENERILCGNFWTNKPTRGFLKLRFVSSDCAESYKEAERRWDIEDQWLVD